MIISTFNIQNNFRKYKKTKTKKIFDYLSNNQIDVLGLQEVFYTCNHDLKKLLKNNYFIKGKYRFFLKLVHLTSNEKTPIVTKHKIISHKTYNLPFRPSHLRRVLTNIVIDYNGQNISIYNTHLESELDDVKQKQLAKIFNIIKKDNLPKIIMGDFNLKNNNPIFLSFEKELASINIKRIPVDEKTFKDAKSDMAIDHIFISNEFKFDSFKVVKDLEISDHYPILVNIVKK